MDARETKIYIAVICTVIVLGIIILFFFISIIRQQRRNMKLQQANILAEISAMERERARIALDLHDDLGPVLSVIKFKVDSVEPTDPEEREILVKASEQLDSLIDRMREVANNLMPRALHRKGLVAAVKEFISKAEGSGNLRIEFTGDEELLITEEKSINIYRAIQEVIHNCMKHAKATKLTIRFEQSGGILTILCRDNGAGFDYGKLSKESSGIGLRSLKNRTEIINGNLVVESKPGKGTAFLFEIPI
jgi:two-component system, NarL family, sensor kinase